MNEGSAPETDPGGRERDAKAASRSREREASGGHQPDRDVDCLGLGHSRHREPADRRRHRVLAWCQHAGHCDDPGRRGRGHHR